MKKLSKKKLREFAMEETAAARLYGEFGLHSFAKDERRHAKFFKMLEKRK